MIKADNRCPQCKAQVGAPGSDGRARCPSCSALLVQVKVIGTGVTFTHYRRK